LRAGHDDGTGRMPGFLRRLRRMAARIDAIVPAARWQRDALARCGVDRAKMSVVENGIAPAAESRLTKGQARRALDLDSDAFLLVQVANYWPERDPTWLLEALAKARRTRRQLQLVLVGRGMDAPAVTDTLGRLGLGGAVTRTGHRDDVAGFLAAADAFVLASRHETLALAALEAMAAALPLIVADIPGFRDVVEHGVHCLKCPAGDSAAMAGLMCRLADDEDLARSLASAARERAKRYTLDRMADRFVRLLNAAIRTARR